MDLRIGELLANFDPLLAGTVPIDIDVETSDLDIICRCQDHVAFAHQLRSDYGEQPDFNLKTKVIRARRVTVARFRGQHFPVEIFGQDQASHEQYAFRHLLAEAAILDREGPEFRAEIRRLKRAGWPTEPAFAHLLGLVGDPYEAILSYILR